jgi:hypothetical protein
MAWCNGVASVAELYQSLAQDVSDVSRAMGTRIEGVKAHLLGASMFRNRLRWAIVCATVYQLLLAFAAFPTDPAAAVASMIQNIQNMLAAQLPATDQTLLDQMFTGRTPGARSLRCRSRPMGLRQACTASSTETSRRWMMRIFSRLMEKSVAPSNRHSRLLRISSS